jgi:hypothetical protein
LKLCAKTACGRKFVRLLDPTVHFPAIVMVCDS